VQRRSRASRANGRFVQLPLSRAKLHSQAQNSASAKEASLANATICFYRPQRLEEWAYKPFIYIGDIEITRLKNGEGVQVIVSPGSHRLYSNDKSTGVDLDAKAGQTYYVRMDMKRGLPWHGAVTLIDPQEGKFEFTKQPLDLTRNLSGQSTPSSSAGTPTPST
jgi:Protein of unknown function (DUF2846)